MRALRVSLVGALAFGLVGAGLIVGMLFVVGCSENLHPNTDRTRVCEELGVGQGAGGFKWWLAVLSPALILMVSQAVPWFRRHPLIAATAIVLVTSAGWTYLLLVVSGNIGDTTISS